MLNQCISLCVLLHNGTWANRLLRLQLPCLVYSTSCAHLQGRVHILGYIHQALHCYWHVSRHLPHCHVTRLHLSTADEAKRFECRKHQAFRWHA